MNQTPRGNTSAKPRPAMAGPSATARAGVAKNAPRNSSIDSVISTISSKSITNKSSPDGSPVATTDVASLIKTAGSAEAVIQYLLKDKQSQSQQNSQLWRLVDKQRAMILGLNKDLERALKEKEKYRKKLKEVMAVTEAPAIPAVPSVQLSAPTQETRSGSDPEPKEAALGGPDSPSLESDSHLPSPIDLSMAPYPITPPADRPGRDGPPSKVGDMLDPDHAMPKPSEHALDRFDHEEQDREAEKARVHADEANDLPINLGLPPSRTLTGPPSGPPPAIPPAGTPKLNNGIGHFPPPAAPPSRKLPPAPLQLKGAKQSASALAEEDYETDSDYDDILQVDEIAANDMPTNDRRGRRRTREEDDREREILARKEAEMRSLSKKSKGSLKGTPNTSEPEPAAPKEALPSSGLPSPQKGGLQRDNVPASLAGVLSGDAEQGLRAPAVPPALLSPGLPASPRPLGMKSPMNSPPLSPLGNASFGGGPHSPRPPRQPIPLPPNTPLQTPPDMEPLNLKSPKPLNIVKKPEEVPEPSPAKDSSHSSDSPMTVERTRIYKGFVTEEFPDLLLPPNALPSVDIKVASSRMKPSRASLISVTQLEEDPVFTLAVYSRADGGELWRVEKDSASLAKLDHRLKQCPAFTARTPDRSLFSGHAPAKLDARRIALDQYLDELLNTPLDLATALELCKYLSTNTLPPNADETGSSLVDPNVEGGQKAGPGGRPFKNGYLTKRGKNFGGWKARYFVLDGPHLKYYETPGGAHLGTIKLQRAQIGKQQGHNNDGQSPARVPTGNEDIDNQYRHAFLILEPKKKDPNSLTKHVLCAESDRERDQWVETLLRWIDYRDPNDEEPPKKDHAHDRHASATQAAHAKRRTQNSKQLQAQHQPADSEDTLLGVSYEATRQGEIPEGAPPRSKHSGAHDQDPQQGKTMSSQPGFSISAPTELQVITDGQPWGSKLGMALAPPNQEEKKARKRSFFGFGPKARTSSDGQDSLFGSDSASISSQQAGSQSSGPVRQVFGATLAEAVRYNSPVDVKVPLPAVVYRCIQYLEARNAVFEEGIFRLSGSNVVIKALRERFNNESDINLLEDEQYYDIHAVASLLKLYLRELPTTILTRDLHLEFLAVTEMPVQSEKIAALSELVLRLPQANGTLLKYLIAFLIKIINHQDSNKMTVRNVGIVFSPTLNIPAPVFAMFLQNYEPIFGIEPTEYELPTPIDQERRPSIPSERSSDGQHDRRPSDPIPHRPSTSGSSPHRQRLMDSLMDKPGSRNTPTPPPVNLQQMAQMNAAQRSSPAQQQRSSPTPPPQRTYEPQYLAQQNAVDSRASARPAYESGFILPQGYDVTQYHPPPSRGNPAAYERPPFEASGSLAPYEQSYGAPSGSKNRRESAIFMSGSGGLRSEGSRSRLREEAQF